MAKKITILGLKDRDRLVAGRKYEGRVDDNANVDVIPGESIRLYGDDGYYEYDKTFKIGDTAVYGRFNLIYTGEIVSIGAKTVTVKPCVGGKLKRMRIYDFNWRNRAFDLESIEAHNARMMMEI